MSNQALNCVVICTVGELFGGVERHVLGMLDGLRARGVETLLVLFNDGELAAHARAQGDTPVILCNRNLSLPATARSLSAILEERRVRLVHVHGYKATVCCALARRHRNFVMVKTEHGLVEQMAGRPMSAARNWLYHAIANVATRDANANVCYVTGELAVHYRHAHSRLRTRVIANGTAVPVRSAVARPPELDEQTFNLAIVGRLDSVKGHSFALAAIASETIPKDIHVHVVGDGPLERDLMALADAHGISRRVHFHGFRRDADGFLAHCDVLLMPSLHEGLPYTLLEAMALGTPVIASRTGGLAEVLSDGLTALLVPPQDSAALGRAIERLYGNPALRARLGYEARRVQNELYSLATMTTRYLELYADVLSERAESSTESPPARSAGNSAAQ